MSASDTPITDGLKADMNEGWPDRWLESHARLEQALASADDELTAMRERLAAAEKAGNRLQEAACDIMNFTDDMTDGEKSKAWVELDEAEKSWDAAIGREGGK